MRPRRACRITVLVAAIGLVAGAAFAQRLGRPKGEKYALLVGVREYDPAELRGLKFSEADIDGLVAVLRRSGYLPENIKVMTQTLGATRARYLPTGVNIRH